MINYDSIGFCLTCFPVYLFLIWLRWTIAIYEHLIYIGIVDLLRMYSNASPSIQHILHKFKSKVIAYSSSIHVCIPFCLNILFNIFFTLLIHGLILIERSMTFSSEVLDSAGGKFIYDQSVNQVWKQMYCMWYIYWYDIYIYLFISWIGLVLPCSIYYVLSTLLGKPGRWPQHVRRIRQRCGNCWKRLKKRRRKPVSATAFSLWICRNSLPVLESL